MDEQKAFMINNWVEKQSVKGDSTVFLTQFKQVEEDIIGENLCEGETRNPKPETRKPETENQVPSYSNSEQCQVLVHQEEIKPKNKQPPPPPPRRTTPPR